ncbi:MAG TPA: MBL fold metallo-hydrolase [Pyrinomonadaceae bacterium]|jgi:hypothetical protein
MFTIEMLPADHGDCLWITYGDQNKQYRILIDGGTPHAYKNYLRRRLAALPAKERRFELLIVTHIDADHIGGSLDMLRELDDLKLTFGDVWFNGWEQIAGSTLGEMQGEQLSARLRDGERAGVLAWNKAFKKRAAVVPENGALPSRQLKGGMKLTLLSPTKANLTSLKSSWEKVIKAAGLIPGQIEDERKGGVKARRGILGGEMIDVEELSGIGFKSDKAVANGSSIAILAEYLDKRLLLTGDAYATVLKDSIGRLLAERKLKRLSLDAFKIPHHGSRGNLSNDLLAQLDCKHYLFSTNGNIFKHPDRESVARVIMHGGRKPKLLFNYRTGFNEMWDDMQLIREYGYAVKYCKKTGEGILSLTL